MRRSKSIASEEDRDKRSLVVHTQEVIEYYREGNSLEKQNRNEREQIVTMWLKLSFARSGWMV